MMPRIQGIPNINAFTGDTTAITRICIFFVSYHTLVKSSKPRIEQEYDSNVESQHEGYYCLYVPIQSTNI